MLVYRTGTERVEPAAELRRLCAAPCATPCATREHAADLLIRLGQLESAIADWLFPESDGEHPTARAMRRASLAAAQAFAAPGREFRAALDALAACELPSRAELTTPEGYAYYGVYPEAYHDAALRFYREQRPERAVVLGIRSIGTSLSAVVWAALEQCGCAVESWTIRPRGHPFDRRAMLSEQLERSLAAQRGAHFAIVDEGPGLSGSSFASVAAKLSALGVPDSRISLFPSWSADAANFRSAEARERWGRHARYAADCERAAPEEGEDISAGRWRERFLAGAPWPAVQPQHERRKFLRPGSIARFAGLGRFGAAKLARAARLAEPGFSPRPLGLSNGFLRLELVPGRPLHGPEAAYRGLQDTLVHYLRFLASEPAAAPGAGFDELLEMIRVNTADAVAPGTLERYREAFAGAPVCAIDGRMLPHEWLLTPRGYIKTDSLDHHDGHFLPGPQNIAWDVAGAGVEFAFEEAALAGFAGRVGGAGLVARLPFYRVAYLAFRIGYARLAREPVAGTPDAARFEALERRYRSQLTAALRYR
ncbi:MAG TPA: hypothetical protein VF767_09200 [Bryobacteraceae bacterium]